jgi:hypothetical protein
MLATWPFWASSRHELPTNFSIPIFQFDYTYLVSACSTIQNAVEADQLGVRIAAVRGHASAIAPQLRVTHAQIIACDLPDIAFDLLDAKRAITQLTYPALACWMMVMGSIS